MAALHLVWNLDRTNPWLWTTKWGIWINCMSSVTCVGDYRSPRGMISSLIKNSMVSSSQSSTLLSSSSVSTPERQKQMSAIFSTFKLRKSGGRRAKVKGSHLLWARGGCSSVLDGSPAPAPCSDDSPPSWTCACPPAPTQTHAHHTFSFMAACTDFITKISDLKKTHVLSFIITVQSERILNHNLKCVQSEDKYQKWQMTQMWCIWISKKKQNKTSKTNLRSLGLAQTILLLKDLWVFLQILLDHLKEAEGY